MNKKERKAEFWAIIKKGLSREETTDELRKHFEKWNYDDIEIRALHDAAQSVLMEKQYGIKTTPEEMYYRGN